MLLLYIIGIRIYSIIIWLFSLFNKKAALFIEGRKQVFSKIANKINPDDKNIWFHFASLGEFEQGRPVLEKIKALHKEKKIIVTFFSPSGYEIRKNYPLADGVFYLPLDSYKNARRFIEIVNPEMAIFTKYEFWYYYFKALNDKNIPLYIISGIFRSDQIFFKSYGWFYKNMLKYVTHFFVQNEESKTLLKSIGFDQVTLSGDTRFDRVYENASNPKEIPLIKTFTNNSPVLICGSTWPADENILAEFVLKHPDWKFIIAPHEIDEHHIENIEKLFPKAIRFTKLNQEINPKEQNVLIIDNIGMLSSLYQYGNIAYIGGGFGTGIHNTLEAVAFGLPVIFGPKYHKFQEAKDLLEIDAAKTISTDEELSAAFDYFKNNKQAAIVARNYVDQKKGATAIIIEKINL